MKLKALRCPTCNAIIDTKLLKNEFVFCKYCGAQIHLDDETQKKYHTKKTTKYIHERYTNDADILHEIRKDKENRREFIKEMFLPFILICMLLYLFLPHYLEKKEAKEKEKQAIKSGLISAGSSRVWIDEDYHSAVAHFESAGFKNIELIDLDDSGVLVWKDGKVSSISIEGKSYFDKDDYFSPDSTVYISYH